MKKISLLTLFVSLLILVGCKDEETDKNEKGLSLTINGSEQFFLVPESLADLEKDNILLNVSFCSGDNCSHSYSIELEDPLANFILSIGTGNTPSAIEALADKTFSAQTDAEDEIELTIYTSDQVSLTLDENATNTVTITSVTKIDEEDEDINYEISGTFTATFTLETETFEVSGEFTSVPAFVSPEN